MKFVPATPQTAVAHAYNLAGSNAEESMALWAGCHLMALHHQRSEVFEGHAEIWASKLISQISRSRAEG
ncbi:hypothetical protein [uncultured Ruegeria sp.]|uniref:hypothetical protein n=1 Tax=uncultured Ruegeria sp. TaxID=259304 RepID=UPI0026177D47|nr:hypothetical protein [uncultured Ruegeria sp.]